MCSHGVCRLILFVSPPQPRLNQDSLAIYLERTVTKFGPEAEALQSLHYLGMCFGFEDLNLLRVEQRAVQLIRLRVFIR